jgi:hypothetical protein
MVIKTTRYSPDTCGCSLEYTWDDSLPESSRTHTLSNYVTKCPAHQGLATDQDRWNAVFEENPRKNFAVQNILDNSPTTALYDTTPSGNRVVKPTVGVNFSWSGTAPNRVLSLSFTGVTLTTNQKNTLNTALNTRFGSGKVTLV